MEDFDDLIDTARDKAGSYLNSGNHDWQYVAVGGLLAVSFTLAVTALANEIAPSHSSKRVAGNVKRNIKTGNLLLPVVFSTNTLSAIRVWNAPKGYRRSSAMCLWSLAQMANIWWATSRPQRLWGQILSAMTSAGLSAAFTYETQRMQNSGKAASVAAARTDKPRR